jgi:CheY-like chemotaxis protein
VLIAVSDNGVGMTADIVARVFEPFFTTKDVGKGSGLGLSMVHGFIKQSGGHVKIYSEAGHGTTVKLYLPVAKDADARPDERRPEQPKGGTERILVVEDDDQVRRHVATQLTNLGYKVVSAANGHDALDAMRSGPFDLLFTDIVMPGGMNGRQLADEARKRQPGLRVLFTSGYTENAIVHQGRLDPGVFLLAKPYRNSDLAVKVRQVLSAPT